MRYEVEVVGGEDLGYLVRTIVLHRSSFRFETFFSLHLSVFRPVSMTLMKCRLSGLSYLRYDAKGLTETEKKYSSRPTSTLSSQLQGW